MVGRLVFRKLCCTQGSGHDNNLNTKLQLQFVHHDHVVIPAPEVLPESWIPFGCTDHCAVQGIYEPGRVLTLQGHFEFDRFVNSECIKHFFRSEWDADRLHAALNAIDADDDSKAAAQWPWTERCNSRGGWRATDTA
jgi:hypothetical protein